MRRICRVICAVTAVLSLLLSANAFADWQLNLTRGVTPISKDIFDLHMVVLWICVGIGAIVFGVLIYSLVMHRKSRGAVPADFHEHFSLEILWAVIPFIILVVMAIPATRVLMNMDDTSKAEVTVKITGYQWKWQYEYLNEGLKFFSNLSTPFKQLRNQEPKGKYYLYEVDNPVVVPIHKKIRFLITSNDVIHSWYVPDLGIKRDAIPGFVHEAWARIEKPGIYRGQCAELCGINHGYMPIVVKAVPDAEYAQWVKQEQAGLKKLDVPALPQAGQPSIASPIISEKKPKEAVADIKPVTLSKADLMSEGKLVYEKYCVACHQANGEGMPPTFPALRASSVAVGRDINRHINIILNGVKGSAMQAFDEQLTDQEIAAVVTYERNAWDNNTGDVVQPNDVKQLRD